MKQCVPIAGGKFARTLLLVNNPVVFVGHIFEGKDGHIRAIATTHHLSPCEVDTSIIAFALYNVKGNAQFFLSNHSNFV